MKISIAALRRLIAESVCITEVDERSELSSIYSDVYKEKYRVRPRHINFDEISIEELRAKLDALHEIPDDISNDELDYLEWEEGMPAEAEFPDMEGTVSPNSTVDPYEKAPTMSGMGKRR